MANTLLGAARDLVRSRAGLIAENALLRQQVVVLQRARPHPKLKARDRFTIAAITKFFSATADAVTIVRPETVIGWHRSLWRIIWTRRSRHRIGRPPIDADTRTLIRRLWTENPLWGENQIAAQLARLGHQVSPRTVGQYRPARLPRGRGQKWSTFVRNHVTQTWACDWFTIVTVHFEILYAFVILDLGRREIVSLAVTSAPSAQFAAQTFVEAVCDRDNQAPRFLIRDRDSIYGAWFSQRVEGFGTKCLLSPPRSPQANSFCERVIGTLRRECLDHIIIRDQRHAERVLREYVRYYHGRSHRGLNMQAPMGANWLPPAQPVPARAVRARPVLGGLHNEYAIDLAA